MFKYVHHVNYAIRDRDEIVAYMERTFGLKPDGLFERSGGDGKEAQYRVGQTLMRFREPSPRHNPTTEYFDKHGPGLYLVSWAVENISQVAQDLIAKGVPVGQDEHSIAEKPGTRQSPRGYFTISVEPQGHHGPPRFFHLAGTEE